MKINDVSKLAERIRQEYGFTYEVANIRAVQLLDVCPTVLTRNIEEWIERKKLTDIYIGQYSLPMIMAIQNSRDFLGACVIMSELDKGNLESAELKIWNMRR